MGDYINTMKIASLNLYWYNRLPLCIKIIFKKERDKSLQELIDEEMQENIKKEPVGQVVSLNSVSQLPINMKENIKKGPVGHVFFLNSVSQLLIHMKENIKKGPVVHVFFLNSVSQIPINMKENIKKEQVGQIFFLNSVSQLPTPEKHEGDYQESKWDR